MSWQIEDATIADLARGAAVLGTGGGGDPYIGGLLARQAITRNGPVDAVTVDELPDDAMVITVALMGAPTVLIEKPPSLTAVISPITAVSAYLGRPATHIACFEAGGVNSTIPVAAAAMLGLPLVDGDGMGRAFPELQMVLPTLYGIAASPVVLGDEKGNVAVLQTIDNVWTERIARVACVEMGSLVPFAGFPMSGAQTRNTLVPGSLRRCVEIGAGIRTARDEKNDPVGRVVEMLSGRELFEGKVVDVQRATTRGFARGAARIEGATGILTLQFQNEHLIADLDGLPLATTPDLIMVLERDSGEPITTEALRYGLRVRVVAAPADTRWHSAAGLALVGPGYFGYHIPAHRFDGSVNAGGEPLLGKLEPKSYSQNTRPAGGR
ncbi:DUF917 domain-containing protein [Mycobacterium simiae]|uniref:DUF917 domain-containing protein n=1 Tax=Mycobacterium simiae TaxID=1784 RepID=A0A5B1BBK8_MYCSI|nr:DUF917 domain-containing protein [Mycobacterium simiae]KAA1245381.1 DUF917 domain-containing protein [Mycobacterium simiae]